MIRASDLPVRDIVEPATVRLVTAGYLDKPAMATLADDPSELAILEEIEGLTSALTPSSPTVPSGIQPGELLTEADGYGWAYVNAAFCHTRPTGNRFNGPERGAWYASYGNNATDTAKAEVAWHLTRELQATGVYDNITTYRELLAGFVSRFHDLGDRTGEAVFSENPGRGPSRRSGPGPGSPGERRQRRAVPVRPLRRREVSGGVTAQSRAERPGRRDVGVQVGGVGGGGDIEG